MREIIKESLYSKMQPTWMRSDCGLLDARIENVAAMKECARRSEGNPFKVILYFRGAFCHEFYCDSIEQGHDAMRRYVENSGGKVMTMNWYALVDGKLVCIGNCGDWEEAYEVACDSIGETEWTWLASQHEVDQWVECVMKTERGE